MSIFRTWCYRIDSGVFSKAQAAQFAAAIYRQAIGYEQRGKRTNISITQADDLFARMIARGGVRLTPEDDAAGFVWLLKYGRRNYGETFPLEDIRDNFSHFLFRGKAEIYGRSTLPIWRVVLKDGRTFDYYSIPWQAMAYDGNRSDRGDFWSVNSTPAEVAE